MLSARWRSVVFCGLALVVIWVLAMLGYTIAHHSRMSAEKIKAYVDSVDISKLSGKAREQALRELADKLNALSADERRRARLDQSVWKWFEQMTEEEKGTFIEATMPTGFKQMLTAFEQLPEDRRRKAIDDSLRRLKEEQAKLQAGDAGFNPANPTGPNLSPELQAKVRTMGLNAFYSQSSAQTKAELAPVLEELQRVMESGRPLRGR
jgi:hypothetical protein